MTIIQQYYETTANTIIRRLAARQMEGFYCATREEACIKALSFAKEGTSVSFGGSMTLEETGILAGLRAKNDITLYDRATGKNPKEVTRIMHEALSCDTYYMSTNAITTEGELVNIDGNGNRVAALIYGPGQVVIVAGMNKVVSDVNCAVTRVRNHATPPNCIRLNKNTPCAAAGVCADCFSPDCICNQIVVTRRSGNPDRIKVILVGEELGY